MPTIQSGDSVVTYITTVNVDPEHQAELLRLMGERARIMARQPGFISISLHRGIHQGHVVNYVQWESQDRLEAAHRALEFLALSERFAALVQDVESSLYDVALVEEK